MSSASIFTGLTTTTLVRTLRTMSNPRELATAVAAIYTGVHGGDAAKQSDGLLHRRASRRTTIGRGRPQMMRGCYCIHDAMTPMRIDAAVYSAARLLCPADCALASRIPAIQPLSEAAPAPGGSIPPYFAHVGMISTLLERYYRHAE